MTTTPTPDVAVTTIDHLDHDPTCHVNKHTHDDACNQTATWWVIARSHCRPDSTVSAFWCTNHHDRVMDGEGVRCRRCAERYELKPLIVRTERIR